MDADAEMGQHLLLGHHRSAVLGAVLDGVTRKAGCPQHEYRIRSIGGNRGHRCPGGLDLSDELHPLGHIVDAYGASIG